MKLVVAVGGNALLRRGEPAEAALQKRNVEAAARMLAGLAADHQVVLTHGNGPQIGLLALEAEAYDEVEPYPLDVLGAESQGMVGYLLHQAIDNLLPERIVAALLTRVVVDAGDPAFTSPAKPIGPVYSQAVAEQLADKRGWSIAADGKWWRRVVPSPEPRSIVDLEAIEVLTDAGALVVCGGGGGIPVVARDGGLEGVEGVIDKDLTSSLLAREIGADMLVMLTDVPAVAENWNQPSMRFIREATPGYLSSLSFAAGSIGPKVDAACRFVEAAGKPAAIGALMEAPQVVAGTAGTLVTPSAETVAA